MHREGIWFCPVLVFVSKTAVYVFSRLSRLCGVRWYKSLMGVALADAVANCWILAVDHCILAPMTSECCLCRVRTVDSVTEASQPLVADCGTNCQLICDDQTWHFLFLGRNSKRTCLDLSVAETVAHCDYFVLLRFINTFMYVCMYNCSSSFSEFRNVRLLVGLQWHEGHPTCKSTAPEKGFFAVSCMISGGLGTLHLWDTSSTGQFAYSLDALPTAHFA